jgi:hypothetical protein
LVVSIVGRCCTVRLVGEWRTDGAVDLVIEAPPEKLYAMVSDVASTGERSSECRSCEWLPDGPQEAVVGARFRGRNRSGLARWSRVCEVVDATPGVRFAFRTVPERLDLSRRDSTTWTYEFEPLDGGTKVTHRYEVTMLPRQPFRALYGRLMPHHRDMRPQMLDTLERLKSSVLTKTP